MAMLSSFDELNIIGLSETAKTRDNPDIEDYFDGMDLDESEKQKRKDLAYDIFGIMSYLFTVLKATEVAGLEHNPQYYKDFISSRLEAIYEDVFGKNYSSMARGFANDVVDTTMKHQGQTDSYWFSDDRAIVDAENQANLVANDNQFQEAIDNGYSQKMWVTKRDKRVRHTHELVDGEILDINKPFEVGTSELMFPCDMSLGASLKEIVNCRCVAKYLNQISTSTTNGNDGIIKFSRNNPIEIPMNLQYFAKTKHVGERQIQRSISQEDIDDALNNPLFVSDVRYDEFGRPSMQYIGEKVTVAVNPDTDTQVTCWKTSPAIRRRYQNNE